MFYSVTIPLWLLVLMVFVVQPYLMGVVFAAVALAKTIKGGEKPSLAGSVIACLVWPALLFWSWK